MEKSQILDFFIMTPIFAAQKNGKTDFGHVLEDGEAM